MADIDWMEFFERWDQEASVYGQLSESAAKTSQANSGATPQDIEAAETRLHIKLPPTYRRFLAVANGRSVITPTIYRLRSTTAIEWFAKDNQDWIDAYRQGTEVFDLPPVPDTDYLRYSTDQDSTSLRVEYLQTALQISDECNSAVLLLNPMLITADGEWEAWFFATWRPGADRYRSFADLMQDLYSRFRRACIPNSS